VSEGRVRKLGYDDKDDSKIEEFTRIVNSNLEKVAKAVQEFSPLREMLESEELSLTGSETLYKRAIDIIFTTSSLSLNSALLLLELKKEVDKIKYR